MTSQAERSARLLLLGFLTVASAGIVALSGCGIGTAAVDAPQSTLITGLHGTMHGGNNPVTGATLSLYATTSGGYGSNATFLGAATTGANGSFAFSGTATCTANQYAYILATGGNPGLTSGFLSAINVTTPGSGYSHVPNVVITSSSGSGATATATVSGGAVTGVTVNAGGSGYTSAPTISFAPTGGDNITTTAVANATLPSNNAAMVMAAALGPCAQVGASTTVDINEITTVAFAYALSGFLPAGGAGITNAGILGDSGLTTGVASGIPGVGTSSTNSQGLKDAFNNSANIVANGNTSPITIAGTPNATGSLSGSNGTVPVSTINSLADILQGCVNSTGPGSTQCSTLFTDASPAFVTGVAAPTNTLQAMIDIAQFPGNNASNLFLNDMVSPTNGAAFQPQLGAAPNDWTIGITYTNALLVSGTGLGINSKDTVYVSGTGYLLSLTPTGNTFTNLAASPVQSTDTLRDIAFDKNDNLFVTDGISPGGSTATSGGVYEYNGSAFTALNYGAAPASNTNTNSYAIAVDGKNDVFTTSYSKSSCSTVTCPLIEYPATATAANTYQTSSPAYAAYTPFASFPNAAVSTLYSAPQPTGALGGARGIAFDVNTGNVWIPAIDDNLGELFKLTPGTGVATASGVPIQLTGLGSEAGTPGTNTGYGTYSVAVDKNSQAWFVTAGGAAVSGSKNTAAISSQITPVSSAAVVGAGITGGGLSTSGVANNVVIDGNNNLFISSTGSTSTSAVIEYDPNSPQGSPVSFLSPNIGFNPGAIFSSGSLSGGLMYEPTYIAIDKAGALWALSSGNGTTHPANLVQVLGVAAPTDPVLANGNYGVKP